MKEYKNQLGKFWIENKRNEEFQGILNLSKNDSTLTLLDKTFDEIEEDYILINGLLKGTSISFTLINFPIEKSSYSSQSGHVKKVTYKLTHIFLGLNYKSMDDIKFKKISFKINNINSIINLNSVNHNFSKNSDKYPVKITPCEKYIIPFKEYTIKIKNNYLVNSELKGNGEQIVIRDNNYIQIEYNEKQNVDKIINDIGKIRNLFNFLTGNSEIIEINEINEGKSHQIILPEIIREANDKRDFYNPINLNKNNIEKVFTKWLNKYDKLTTVYDLFFSIEEYNADPATLLITYSQIIESYHRQIYNSTYISPEGFKDLTKKIRKTITQSEELKNLNLKKEQEENFINKIVSPIGHSYEYSLKDRLIELFNDLNKYSFFKKILKRHSNKEDEEAINELSKIIKDNRNYYTHYGEENKSVLKGIELLELNDSLRNIIKLIFLKDLGFTFEEIEKYTKRNHQFSFITYIK